MTVSPPATRLRTAFMPLALRVATAVVLVSASGCDLVLDLGHLDKPVPSGAGSLSCLTVDQTAMDFGLVGSDRVEVRDLAVTNDCGVPVSLDTVAVDSDQEFWLLTAGAEPDRTGDFGLSLNGGLTPPWASTSLAPGAETSLRVAFRGTHHRSLASGMLDIAATTAGASGTVSVALLANSESSCLDVEVAEYPGLDFGCQKLGVERAVGLTVTSCGGAAATLTGAALSGSDAFRLVGAEEPVTLAPGEQHSLRIVYKADMESTVTPVVAWDVTEVSVFGEGDAVVWSSAARAFSRHTSCTGLEVELTWSTPGDSDPTDTGMEAGADLDLHVMHPLSLGWYRYPFDAFWINRNPNWGDFSSDRDNPFVGSDSVDGTAPELVSMELPEEGNRYRIGVHYWDDHGYGPSDATVVVRYFGKEVFRRTRTLSAMDMWDVGLAAFPGAEVLETGGGAGAITPGFEAPCDRDGCKAK